MRGAFTAGVLGLGLMAGTGYAGETEATFGERNEALKKSTGLSDIRVEGTAGVAAFTGGLGGLSGFGPLYGVTAGGTWAGHFFGFEGGYEGSRIPLDGNTTFLPGGAMWRHNAYGMAKAGLPLGGLWPFIGAGLGISFLDANNPASFTYENDVLGEIPLALGLDYNRGAFTAGLRGTYRVLFADEFAEPVTGEEPGGGLISGSLTVGARF